MKVLFALLALLALAAAAPHKREEGTFDYDYKLFDDDMFDREGVAVDRMIGKKMDIKKTPEHHHHHHHHHHKEHLKTNRISSFFDSFRL